MRNKRLLLITLLLMTVSSLLLGLKVGYPHHRVIAFGVWLSGWIPVAVAYRQNRRMLRVHKAILKKKARPFRPHLAAGVVLSAVFYVVWVLFPAETSPLVALTDGELRSQIEEDLGTYRMLTRAGDDLLAAFESSGLLGRKVDSLAPDERAALRSLWRDGVMAFLEGEVLHQIYRGFYQLDYLAKPGLHADAFFVAYAASVTQQDACFRVVELIGDNPFLETLLNESGEGIPADTYFAMKQGLTHPRTLLRLNAAAAYYELVKKDLTIDPEQIAGFEERRSSLYRRWGRNPEVLVDNPLDVLERTAFSAWFPLQKRVAVQMSHIRTARRDYFITPDILDHCRDRLRPGDILVERRNWRLTNIGIPGFWPHAALYVGTLAQLEAYFAGLQPADRIRDDFPDVYAALSDSDDDGHPRTVIESIRPGVILQSLEKSAHCDYLGAFRPQLDRAAQLNALLAAFSYFGRPYDLNFDFTTDGSLVCSELVYKAYASAASLPLEPDVINGRLLLSPNRMVEQVIDDLEHDTPRFSFVLFLDASERDQRVVEAGLDAFEQSWSRPKWDLLQE